ncbi:MAG: tetratricopeptide repeat protein [Candidatus Thorarchaeota archaeon]
MNESTTFSNAQSYFNKALHYLEFDESHAAIDSLRTAVKIAPDFAKAWHLLGSLLQENGSPDEARSCFENAVELDPHDAQLWQRLGIFEFSQERYRASRKALKKYVGLGGKEQLRKTWTLLDIHLIYPVLCHSPPSVDYHVLGL